MIQFHGDADGKIGCGKGFSFTGQRTGHHDQVTVPDWYSSLAHGVVNQWPLDDAKLVGQLGTGRIGPDDAGG
ncbi:hypothetical protein D3C72_2479370 [compost metagenome]